MKHQMTYAELQKIAYAIAEDIKARITNPYLFAVVRGGMTLAQLVGYKLAMPVGTYYPASGQSLHPSRNYAEPVERDATYVYLEDVIATGRTVQCIHAHMKWAPDTLNYEIYPAVIDSRYDGGDFAHIAQSTALITPNWVVFPYEEMDRVVEGDHGLFRDGTSTNSQKE